jgi:hypothetical protein
MKSHSKIIDSFWYHLQYSSMFVYLIMSSKIIIIIIIFYPPNFKDKNIIKTYKNKNNLQLKRIFIWERALQKVVTVPPMDGYLGLFS